MREAARDYGKLTAVPKELAQREAELESRGYQVRRGWGLGLAPGVQGLALGALLNAPKHSLWPAWFRPPPHRSPAPPSLAPLPPHHAAGLGQGAPSQRLCPVRAGAAGVG